MARDLASDEGRALFERFSLTIRAQNRRKPITIVLFLMEFPGLRGRAPSGVPEEFGKRSSVYRQFRRWTLAGLWEEIMDAMNQSGAMPDDLQMIDSTVIRARHPLLGS
ncbi:transposase [Actibacterium sp. 188UL27-1]|nr:transposase [Actibacterium sp. 188UL27-1]